MKQKENLKTIVRVILVLLVMAGVYFSVYRRNVQNTSGSVDAVKEKPCVVIDAGHGSGNLRKVTKGK